MCRLSGLGVLGRFGLGQQPYPSRESSLKNALAFELKEFVALCYFARGSDCAGELRVKAGAA